MCFTSILIMTRKTIIPLDSASLLDSLPSCDEISEDYSNPVVDLILIVDGSRDVFSNLQLIS